MKKILFFALLLVCISAFAFKPNFCRDSVTTVVKIKKETPKHSPTPIADMAMFPHLSL